MRIEGASSTSLKIDKKNQKLFKFFKIFLLGGGAEGTGIKAHPLHCPEYHQIIKE